MRLHAFDQEQARERLARQAKCERRLDTGEWVFSVHFLDLLLTRDRFDMRGLSKVLNDYATSQFGGIWDFEDTRTGHHLDEQACA